MESIRRARTAGTVGIIAGVLWIISWAIQAFMAPTIGTGSWRAEQAVATVALFGSAFLFFGLAWARTAGDGKIVRTILVINSIAWLLIGVATASAAITGEEWGGALGGVLFPIGAMISAPATVVVGIIIAVKHRLGGWQRWMPLVFRRRQRDPALHAQPPSANRRRRPEPGGPQRTSRPVCPDPAGRDRAADRDLSRPTGIVARAAGTSAGRLAEDRARHPTSAIRRHSSGSAT
jgi:hypothetical protein